MELGLLFDNDLEGQDGGGGKGRPKKEVVYVYI